MQQITRGDYLKDLITIFIENNLQTDITELYSQFIFQCGEIQKVLTPAQVIKISFDEIESQLLKSTNTCYLAGITTDGHKETFNGSLTFNTRGEVVYYEPPVSTVIPAATETNCDCHGLRGFFSNCTQPAIKAYFSLNYVPTKLSELQNDTDFVDSFDLTRAVSEHNTSTEAHQYIQDLVATEASLRASQTNALGIRIGTEESVRASQTEALHQSILAETTAREEAVSLAITTTEAYADSIVQGATTAINTTIGDLDNLDTSVKSSVVNAINSEVTARENADNNLQTQIDGLAAASDVTDIVGTYQELQNYDTQHLNNNDIIKVLSDETHDDEPSYYRFNKTAGTFSYIGSESASYTKAQSNSIFVTQTTEINGHALSSDINLTASDVGALSDTTTINDLTNTAQQNALNSGVTSSVVSQVSTNTSAIATNTSAIASNTSVIAQHTTAIASNTSDISTINGKIPTDASSTNKLVSASTLSASIANFANKDLLNLTSNGEGRLHALKSYADEGELLTDPDGLAFVEKYAHSTFDKSKFNLTLGVETTDNGEFIIDGNAKRCKLENVVPSTAADFEFKTRLTINSVGQNGYIFQTYPNTDNVPFSIFINTNLVFAVRASVDVNGTKTSVGFTGNQGTFVAGKTYDFIFERKDGKFTYGYKLADAENYTTGYVTDNYSTYPLWGSDIEYFIGQDIQNISYKVDMKNTSVKANGVYTFVGNKTGIDTIKPDDYTVVGSPTISADGIYQCNTNTSNYITVPQSVMSQIGQKAFKIYYESVLEPVATSYLFGTSKQANEGFVVGRIYNNDNLIWRMMDTTDNSIQLLLNIPASTGLIGKKYLACLEYDGNNTYTMTLTFEGGTIKTNSVTSSNKLKTLNYDLKVGQDFANKFNLNAFKIYIDGNLVYQPCLKIPYTESKTGSKIVNAVYRDRVNDMADQFGYANYYTLSDTDFTLPQVELYGLIGQRTLRDSYRNGINYWELYSNRDLEQGGSCTSGVEITFARPFADTNYVLSVPYSAKSTTAFTPTQTGDWIAKGKGIL